VAKITFRIDDSRAVAKLRLLASAAANPLPVYRAIGQAIKNRVLLGFKFGRDPWGGAWRPIKFRAPRTSEATGKLTKAGRLQVAANASGKAGQPLVNTGKLRSSISFRADASGVTIGTNDMPRAAVHQFGATILPKKGPALVFPGPAGAVIFAKRVTIPARPFLPLRRPGGDVALPPAWAVDVIRAIKGYLQKAPQKTGA
jgi:phage gpG-like protein